MRLNIKDFVRKQDKYRLWVLVLIIILGVVSSAFVYYTYTNTEDELVNIANQIDPSIVESGVSSADYGVPEGAEKVTTGIYIDRIKSLSLKDNLWTVEFYVWFKWSGNINPGESFQVVDGSIDSKELIKNSTNGTENYSLYKVTSTITKKFDMFRFPVDTQFLTINIMDTQHGRDALTYIPDNDSSSIGSNVDVQGYSIVGLRTIEKPFYYNTTMGDPTNGNSTYSQFRSEVLINRDDLTFLFVSLIGILIAVFAGLMSLLIMSYQGRFSLEGSAMFVGITNMVLITNLAPTGIITLGHLITGYGLFIIALCLLESAISIIYHKRDAAFSRKLDIVTLKILSIGFIITFAAIILVAWTPLG